MGYFIIILDFRIISVCQSPTQINFLCVSFFESFPKESSLRSIENEEDMWTIYICIIIMYLWFCWWLWLNDVEMNSSRSLTMYAYYYVEFELNGLRVSV